MIYELLDIGRENVITSTDLKQVLHCNDVEIRAQVARERKKGKWICAASGTDAGYYIARDCDELLRYINDLTRRIDAMIDVKNALMRALKTPPQHAMQITVATTAIDDAFDDDIDPD